MKAYDHRQVEGKWQKKWASAKLYKAADKVKGKKNFYLLTEFPYPSGNLHVGHWYAFSVPDILARHLRMIGKNVLYPFGFDAFGLPAENAAIKNKLNPRKWTEGNIAYMKKQIARMGASFDWSREVQTIDPGYYKWTQWQFLQFFKNKLAYRKETAVNWCPSCKTVLANEQVDDGKCERCGSEVIQKQMLQWNLKITKYADRLVDDLGGLDWPEQIKESQRNWIGRSEGIEIQYAVDTGKKYTVVILHGWQGTPEAPRYKHWKQELEKMGHTVIIPALPNSDKPREDEQVKAALEATDYDENTVLFGHSLGCAVAMKVVEKLKKPIAKLVLAGGFADRDFQDKKRPFEKTFVWKFDGEKIKKNARAIQLVHDPNDYAISEGQVKRLEDLLGVKAFRMEGEKPHFTGEREIGILPYLAPMVRVFTTRPDTNFGATFVVAAPEGRFVAEYLEQFPNADEVKKYRAEANKKTELERIADGKKKTGVFTGWYATNQLNGKRLPLYIGDFVLGNVGTGVVVGVPGHDKRDFEFSQAMGIEVVRVVIGKDGDASSITDVKQVQEETGTMVNSGFLDGMDIHAATKKVMNHLEEKGWGKRVVNYKLRDWIVSRQRYWGVPIPIIHCQKCGEVAVPDKDLPVKLPEVKDYLPDGKGKSPLAKAKKWVNVKCPQCKGKAERETDTLDTFVDSSWYFLRYADSKNKKKFADAKKIASWMPVSLYSGGAEHTTMHVLYSRFWQKALYDLGLVKDKEPYTRRMNRSIILGPDGQKMSKSKGNVVDPDKVVAQLGADTVRMYLAFIGPYNEVSAYPWNPDGVVGVRRFLERVWRLSEKVSAKPHDDVEVTLHKTIKKVSEDIPALKFNTAIAQMMMFLNEVEKNGITKMQYETLLRLLAPFAPHIADELWSLSGKKKSVHVEPWPKYDAKKLVSETVTIAVQINGKTRGTISIPTDSDEKEVRAAAEKESAIARHIAGQSILKVVYVKNRLLNFVLAPQ
jgi:leucyl-tRNA synthetase